MRFAPQTDDDVREMLRAIGVASLDDLFDQIPEAVRLDRPLDLPDGVSEMEIVADLRRLAARNRHADELVCFAGAGAYDHRVPAFVWPILSRGEFLTAYTPYQTALSEGVNIAMAATGRHRVVVAGALHPHWGGVLATQGAGLAVSIADGVEA